MILYRYLSTSAVRFNTEHKNEESDAVAASEDTSSEAIAHDEPAHQEAPYHAPAPAASPEATAVDASRLAESEGRSVFVGGLSWNLDNDWLKEEVEKALEITEGVVSVRIARDHMGRSKGYVHPICLRFPSPKSFNSSFLNLDPSSPSERHTLVQ